jgi:hypothetical protein
LSIWRRGEHPVAVGSAAYGVRVAPRGDPRECYAIPLAWVPWAVMSAADVSGLGQLGLPDGTRVLGPVGLNGQYLLQTLRRTND